jgi:hypothetical protein
MIDCRVGDRYTVKMPEHIADPVNWEHWEKERCLSMETNLRKGDILFDIGSETGWASAIYARFVGPENMACRNELRTGRISKQPGMPKALQT